MNSNAMKELQSDLGNLKGSDQVLNAAAYKALIDAAEEYEANHPIVDKDGRRSRPSIAEARSSQDKLLNKMVDVQTILASMPINARIAFANSYEAPVGKFVHDLQRGIKAAEKALTVLKAEPDKVCDFHRKILAYRVAQVFRDILGRTPAKTNIAQGNVTGSSGGGEYAQILLATLKVANIHNPDLWPLISAGVEMLDDKSLP